MLHVRAGLLASFARVIVLAALFAAPHLFAGQISSDPDAQSLRYQYGDDPSGSKGWANPSFDDSSWSTTSQNQWPRPAFNSDGFIWVRFSVPVRNALAEPLSLRVSSLNGPLLAYELFLNGARVGSFGKVPPQPLVESRPRPAIFDLSSGLTPPRTVTQVALRIWYPPSARQAGAFDSLLLTLDQSRLLHAEDLAARQGALLRNLPLIALNSFVLLVGLVVLLLARSSHSRDLQLYGALIFTVPWITLYFEIADAGIVTPSVPAYYILQVLSQLPCMIITIEFIWRINNLRAAWLKRIMFAAMILFNASLLLRYLPSQPSWIVPIAEVGQRVNLNAFSGLQIAIYLWVIFVKRQKRMIAFAMALVPVAATVSSPDSGIRITAGRSLMDLAFFLAGLCLSAVLAREAWKEWRVRDALKAEFEAARQVQQLLVPAENPEIPGLHIECLYHPAGQVGGDFYQVVHTASGSALVVIGDVSGKGMPAAMTVSLLVGTFRTLAHYTQSPGEILRAMNVRMLARSQGGFTTCLVLHIDPSGTLTAASAGHLAPYVNGQELQLQNGLPLGLAAETHYAESSLQLPPSARLTLITDGVVEARNASGELFGFDRTASIATQTAGEIAAAAQNFGQEDDITVLTLTRLAVAHPAAANALVTQSAT